VTPEEEEARIRELAKLIEAEKDAEKMVVLAAELERVLTLKLKRHSTVATDCEREAEE
jgi:hypothetical protein